MEVIEDYLQADNKVSRIWGETKGGATDRDCALVLKRRGGDPFIAEDEISWEEPYKDAGPDAAHGRLREMREAS
jgi:site-specific DNA-methyltransferase (adenine-specific)